MAEFGPKSSLINNNPINKSKYNFNWGEISFEQSLFLNKQEIKSIKVLRVLASQQGRKLGKVFKVVDHEDKYEVGLIEIKKKVYFLFVPALGEFASGIFQFDNSDRHVEKIKGYMDSYRKQHNIPIEIDLVFDWPWNRMKAGHLVEVTLEEIKKYQQQPVNNVVQLQHSKDDPWMLK